MAPPPPPHRRPPSRPPARPRRRRPPPRRPPPAPPSRRPSPERTGANCPGDGRVLWSVAMAQAQADARSQPGAVENLLEVKDLVTEFRTEHGTVRAVDRVSFEVAPGRTIGVVGESGCGKSVTALSIMRLIPS